MVAQMMPVVLVMPGDQGQSVKNAGEVGSAIEHLNARYFQLGLFALVFGGLQVWGLLNKVRPVALQWI